jgi:hypothetical protein
MQKTDPNNYTLIGFRPSKTRNKKYDAILQLKSSKRLKYVPFGEIGYFHYRDDTPLGIYTLYNHYNQHRRHNYSKRHFKDIHNKFTPGWFSWKYLWGG